MILIEPDPDQMGDKLALNNLFITAELPSGDDRTKLEVVRYSEVGQSQAVATGQRGMAFESTRNVAAMRLLPILFLYI